MTDLESRMRDELSARALDAGPARLSGPQIRRAASARRARRLRSAAVLGTAATVAAIMAAAALIGTSRNAAEAPPSGVTSTPSPTFTGRDGSPLQVAVPDHVVNHVRNVLGMGNAPLIATVALPSSGRTALVFVGEAPPGAQWRGRRMTAYTVTLDGTTPVPNTYSDYGHLDDVIAQPVRDGADALLLVLVPKPGDGDEVVVTIGRAGQASLSVTRPITGQIALVPLPAPDLVTELRVLRGGEVTDIGIPGGSLLKPDAPDRLPHIAASRGPSSFELSSQLRTNGHVACWVGAPGFEPHDQFIVGWNLIESGCARADGNMHLLLPEDRQYAGVGGLAPDGADRVRLTWRNGTTTEVPVVGDETVTGFADPTGHRADQLVRAEAVDSNGKVIASEEPGPTHP